MSAQSSLPGGDAAPKQTDRLFFAIFPDAGAAARIAQLCSSGFGMKGNTT
ncbi:hypothetical protein [Collimonas sp. OK307]|nr:hypothetical protein [Collimonas sp. OK307]